MKKLLLTLSLPLFLLNQTQAQSLGHIVIVSAPPCTTPGLSGTIVIAPVPGVDYFHWFTVPQAAVLLNGAPPPYETAGNTVYLTYNGSTPSYSLCVYGYNSCCFTDTACINYPCITGIEEQTASSSINISPNPFTDQLTIYNPKNEEGEIVLYDIAGRVVAQTFLPFGQIRWDLQLSNGMYLYEVRSGSGVLKKGKVVKQ